MGDNPIVPIFVEIFVGFFEVPFGGLEAFRECGTGIVRLLELIFRHRQHHLGLHLAGPRPLFGQSFLQPLHRAGEAPLAMLSQAFNKVNVSPRLMGRVHDQSGVSHFADGLEIGCGWREYQAIFGDAFGDDGVGSARKLAEHLFAVMLVAIQVSGLQKQRRKEVRGQVIRWHEFDRPGIVCQGRLPLAPAGIFETKDVEERDH